MILRSVDLFCGGGGLALGLRRAGHEHVLCVDSEARCIETIRAAGFPGIVGDVGDLDLYRDVGPVDLVVGGPPCQGFSQAGKRLGALDPRNGFPAWFKALDEMRPTWALSENVDGLTFHSAEHCGDSMGCPGCYLRDWILPEFRSRFAHVQWAILNAVDFGNASQRKRIFILAGPHPLKWPARTHGSPDLCAGLFGPSLLPWRTVRDALTGLAPELGETARVDVRRRRNGEKVYEGRSVDIPGPTVGAAYGDSSRIWISRDTSAQGFRDGKGQEQGIDAPAMTLAGNMGGILLHDPKHPPAILDAPAPVIRSGGDGHSPPPMYLRPEGGHAKGRSCDEPAPSITSGGDHGTNLYAYEINPGQRHPGDTLTDQRRRLTVQERSRLMGFPDDWPWQGTQEQQGRQIGNAVAVPMAEALGRMLADYGGTP